MADRRDRTTAGKALAALGCAVMMAAGTAAATERLATEGPANEWSSVPGPAPGPARVFGAHSAGCIAGAEPLPPDGEGYQAVDLDRRRYYGHPELVTFVRDLGRAAAAMGMGTLLVGDMAQPRGGPMASGHVSHQTGLDVDIWFRVEAERLPLPAREGLEQPPVVDPATGRPDPALWTLGHAEMVRWTASDPRVARVFVGPALKRDLCERPWADRSWLRRVRPWPGHDDHMHVRLACPAGEAACVSQPPPPPGDGCGAALDPWFGPAPPAVATRPAAPRHPQCRAVLTADTAAAANNGVLP
ncbi:penicillin-insensitive murein endopeptidase [Azospirillum halopraeferens]|uniref:penicillin-insensitive murein endopeptidase n=1 Tax=Azospirillum halopraeferens TaxID=34010 RepID=UPI000409816D|nr:penicillin-insensitive murein endopeptidase [Azospirillum halopraeferens]